MLRIARLGGVFKRTETGWCTWAPNLRDICADDWIVGQPEHVEEAIRLVRESLLVRPNARAG